MKTLVLVKHSLPEIVQSIPPTQWHLSETGRARCAVLAQRLASYGPVCALFCSLEPKAVETAECVSEHLALPFEARAGFEEHDRSSHRFLPAEAFDREIRKVFEQPHERSVLGMETGAEACDRFVEAVAGLAVSCPAETAIVVTHGTVMSLFAARYNAQDGYALWRQLKLPSFLVFSVPEYLLQTVVPMVAE